ncbi:hypothetical protein JRQ81_001183 [Phrynocephalus forsythii]|uniref:PDZ domain-containing protein n=1 Tax=Phrynocephalus forsythii TaxID=171643 RepID=A0A9Q0Y7I9_9SAUR|nr:hypothetical protein JRQ81_001183 [Phrynocephalus forsythii]
MAVEAGMAEAGSAGGGGASGRQLRPDDTEADGEADAEDDSVTEVTTENIRPRPQGSSPVYEYCIEDEYFNKKLQQDIENRQRRDSALRMSDSQESMEVTLQTEVDSGASGFSVAGGGNEGIFVKQVLKESPASKLFNLREGDQLLSATIFFDNIKYEDALKILQYSEPYKVQFSLKRKLAGKEELEAMHSATQSKKEKLSQRKENLDTSEKMISEEDQANLIVKQRAGRPKRPKKDRLSWPKFQSMKGKKILGHRRSRSTSDAYEHAIPDISPTSTDTESQFQTEENNANVKKVSQKKLKFPSIGFKMHRSKQETEERTKYEVKPLTEYENDTTGEIPELITTECLTSWDKEVVKEEKHEPKKHIKEKNEKQYHSKKYPEVELTIKKGKEKKTKSHDTKIKPEDTILKLQITTPILHEDDINEGEMKQKHQKLPKIKKKKQKGLKEKLYTDVQEENEKQGGKGEMIIKADVSQAKLEHPEAEVSVKVPNAEESIEGGGMRMPMPKFKMPSMGFSKTDIKAPKVDVDVSLPKGGPPLPSAQVTITKPDIKGGDIASDVRLSTPDVKIPTGDLKAPGFEMDVPPVDISVEGPEVKLEGVDSKFKMPKFHMPKFGVSIPKGKASAGAEITLPDAELPEPEVKAGVTLPSVDVAADEKFPEAEIRAPSVEVEVGEKGKFKMPDVKMPSIKGPKVKMPHVDVSLPVVEADVSLGQAKLEGPETEVSIKVPDAEGSIEGGGMRMHMPKFKMPSMGFSKPDIKAPKVEVDVSLPKGEAALPSAEVTIPKPEVKVGDLSADVSLSAPDVKLATGELKAPEIETPSVDISMEGPKVKLEGVDSKFKMPKFHMPKFGVSIPKGKASAGAEITSTNAELPKPEVKAGVTLPSVDVTADMKFPEAEIQAPSVEVEVGEKGKFKMPDVKMPSIKGPKVKIPHVDVSLPMVEADVSLGQAKLEGSETEVSIKVPDAEGSIDGGGMRIHMPKVKTPSMGFSKTDIPGDVDVSLPKGEAMLPLSEITIPKPELKVGDLDADVSMSAPDVKLPTGGLKAPGFEMEVPPVEVPWKALR